MNNGHATRPMADSPSSLWLWNASVIISCNALFLSLVCRPASPGDAEVAENRGVVERDDKANVGDELPSPVAKGSACQLRGHIQQLFASLANIPERPGNARSGPRTPLRCC